MLRATCRYDRYHVLWAALVLLIALIADPCFAGINRIENVQVKAVHNGQRLALLLSWRDATQDAEVVRVQSFSDGAAVQFSMEKDPPFFGMGQDGSPVYIWHWKAVWEQAGDDRRDVEHAYPNMAVDWLITVGWSFTFH